MLLPGKPVLRSIHLRILLTHLFSRPYVRRGGETHLEELSHFLVARGDEVNILTTKPGKAVVETVGPVTYVRVAQPPGILSRSQTLQEIFFAYQCFRFMLRERFDLIHCMHYTDACGARLAGWFTKVPYVYYILGIPVWKSYIRRPFDFAMLHFAVHGARQNLTVSRFAASHLLDDFGLSAIVLEPPCDIDKFHVSPTRDLNHPIFLAVGAFVEPRKGLRVLLGAFPLLKQRVPGAELVISGHVNEARLQHLLARLPKEVRSSIRVLGVGDVKDLPQLYAEAAVTVLPSMWEAFGLVLVEALASGTPVVGTRHGGIPEVIEPGVGVLFDPGTNGLEIPDPHNLATAMEQALQLYADPLLQQHCREAAGKFSWASYGNKLNRVHDLCARRELQPQ
jgi:phosphatidyl-myo-inositol alpha-mannosyltransferase